MNKIWIALPAYNEEEALPPLIKGISEHLTFNNFQYSIIIVDDGSKDRTGELIEEWAKTKPIIPFHNNPNKGLAETLRRGLLEAVKRASDDDIVITLDADNTHLPGLMPRMIARISEGNDVVIASRYREGSAIRGVPWNRLLLSLGAAWLFRLVFPIPGVRDYTCGYRAYRVTVLKQLISKYGEDRFVSERGFSCMVDVLLRLREFKPICCEVPIVLRYDYKPGASKMKVLQTVLDTLKLMIKRRLAPGS